MNISLSNRMNGFTTSIFNELAAYKKQKILEGKSIIDLSIGSPDLAPPTFVQETLARAVLQPELYQYALTATPELEEAVIHYYEKQYNVELTSKEIGLTMGSQDGLVHLPLVLTNPGDIILVPNPGYTAYAAGIALAEAVPYFMPIEEKNEFLPDLEQIPEDVCQRAKLMILNFPGNPVPAVAPAAFFKKVVEFATKYNIVILHDFAYSELYYEKKPLSFLSIEGAKDIGIEFNSLSKSFNMAGCRIGYVAGNFQVVEALNRLKSNLDFGVFLPVQQAAVHALTQTSNFSEELRSTYLRRRDVLVNGLQALGWNVRRPDASMFIWAKVLDHMTSTEFAYKLIDQAGVVTIPGVAFGSNGEGYVRIALVQEESVLKEAIERIQDSNIFGTNS